MSIALQGYTVWKQETTTYGRTYNGPAEMCTFTFKTGPEQLAFLDNWLRNNLIRNFKAELEKEGAKLIHTTIYRDIGPIFDTWWKVEVTADVSGGLAQAGARMASPFPWALIIGFAVAAVIGYFLMRPVIESITDLFWGTPGDGIGGLPWGLIIIGILILLVIMAPRRKA